MAARGPNRRAVLGALAASGLLSGQAAFAQAAPKLVVIGGGFGGATAARALKAYVPAADVTLVEPGERYYACPFSNLVVAGLRALSEQQFDYADMAAVGIRHVAARAASVDASARDVTLEDGSTLKYDRLVLSPGIDMRWSALEGYDETATSAMPHAWKAGAETLRLRDQLRAMDEGGVVVMSAPAAPYRCPPGPYERASLIAHYLKMEKPRSKLIILDAKDQFSKMPLFLSEWSARYGTLIEWRGAADDGRVVRVDPQNMTLHTDFDDQRADVANIIPPQKAAAIADAAGVSDSTGWCPVNPVTFESTLQPNIHVIGDAIIAAPMPKSAFSANLQAKVCAIQIARTLAGAEPAPTVLTNTCYSYVAPDAAVSISGVYSNEMRFADVPGAGGLSPLDASAAERAAEATQAQAWFDAITGETFGA
ncbi:MAG: NAD(P)/FAD-dependent oxidoreductase [Pseudomonadota bacterium]